MSIVIQWIAIYPVDSVIQSLNNWAMILETYPPLPFSRFTRENACCHALRPARFACCDPERPTETLLESEASGSKICRHVYEGILSKRKLSLSSFVSLSILVRLEEYDGVWEV